MKRKRRTGGSAIAETGPALFILLVMTIFPVMTLLGLGAQYCFAWYHNHLVLQELAQRRAVDGGAGGPPGAGVKTPVSKSSFASSPVGIQIANGFDKTGMARFIGVTKIDDAIVYYGADPGDPTTQNRIEVLTTLTGRPFVPIPFLNWTKMDFNISGETTREVTQ